MTLLAAALIALAAGIVYFNSFQGKLLFDDQIWIVDNPYVHRLWPVWPIIFPAKAAAGQIGGRPLVSLTLALNYWAGGTDPRGYHAVNLAIHILAAWVLFGVVRRTLLLWPPRSSQPAIVDGDAENSLSPPPPASSSRFAAAATPLAFAAALIWTVHPLQTAAVTYVIQRTESMVALFYLLTLYCVIRGAASVRNAGNWYMAATLSCLAGMLTKEVMATGPLIVLLYDRTFLSGSFKKALAERLDVYLCLAATWVVIPWVLISTGFHEHSAGSGVEGFTSWTYL